MSFSKKRKTSIMPGGLYGSSNEGKSIEVKQNIDLTAVKNKLSSLHFCQDAYRELDVYHFQDQIYRMTELLDELVNMLDKNNNNNKP